MKETSGERLRVAMRFRGYSKLSAMAAAVMVSESAVCRWCRDGAMTVDNVVAVCDALDISADWLLRGRGGMASPNRESMQSHDAIYDALTRISPRAVEHLGRFLANL